MGNHCVTDLDSQALITPKLKHGCVECVFYNYQHPVVKGCQASVRAAQLFHNAVRVQTAVPLRFAELDSDLAAADAFAAKEHGGLGGWWIEPDTGVHWFSFQITWADLPSWFRPKGSSMQWCVAALEALAQLLLLVARASTQRVPNQFAPVPSIVR